MIWIAKFFYTALKWLVALITQDHDWDMAKRWFSLHLAVVFNSFTKIVAVLHITLIVGKPQFYTMMDPKSRVVHAWFTIGFSARRNWPYVSQACMCMYTMCEEDRKKWLPLIKQNWKFWQVLRFWLPQQPEAFLYSDAYRTCLNLLLRTPLNEINSVCVESNILYFFFQFLGCDLKKVNFPSFFWCLSGSQQQQPK